MMLPELFNVIFISLLQQRYLLISRNAHSFAYILKSSLLKGIIHTIQCFYSISQYHEKWDLIIYSTFVFLSFQVWVKIIFILMSMGMVRPDITSFISVAMRSPEPTIGLELASITKVSFHSTCQVNHLDTSLIFVGVLDLWCSRSSERATILTVCCIIQVFIFISPYKPYLLTQAYTEASLSWSQ